MKKLLFILFLLPLTVIWQKSYLPAKKVEAIRFKIFTEAQKQLADTIKKK